MTSTESKRNHDTTWAYYVSIGLIPKETTHYDYVLHHKDTSLKENERERYDEWRIEDVIPLTWAEHNTVHHSETHENYNKGGYKWSEEARAKVSGANNHNFGGLSEETKRKLSESCKGKRKGELNPNYGNHEPKGPQTGRTKRHWKIENGKHIYY